MMPDYEPLVDAESGKRDVSRYRRSALYYVIILIAVVLLTVNFLYYAPKTEESGSSSEPATGNSEEVIEQLPVTTTPSTPEVPYNYDDLPPCNLAQKVEKPFLDTEAILTQFWRCAWMILMRFTRNPEGLVFNWPYTIYVCDEEDEIAKIPVKAFDNGERKFWAVLPRCKEESTFVTLGSGSNSKAQQQLTSLVKNVTTIGTDPSVEKDDSYDNFYQVAISSNHSLSGELAKFFGGNSTVDQYEFFNETVGVKKIDMLWINQRHGKFEYWDYLNINGTFDKMGITVCQLNIEITMEDAENWQKFITPVITNHRFIFMRPMATQGGKQTRTFFLNAKDPQCIRKYLQ